MSYLVKYTGDGVEGQIEPGKVVYWKNGESRIVDNECISFYQDHTGVFEIVNSDLGTTLDPDNVTESIATNFPGHSTIGYIHFGGAAEAEATVTIGGVVFTEADTAAAATGVFTNGASAAESATSFLAAVNGDERASNPFIAWAAAGTDGVWIGSVAPTDTPIAITTTSAANIVVPETTTGGSDSNVTKKLFAVTKTVTTHELLSGATEIQLPGSVTVLSVQAFTAAGAQIAFTDLVTIGADPARLIITTDGATNLANGNVVHVIAVG